MQVCEMGSPKATAKSVAVIETRASRVQLACRMDAQFSDALLLSPDHLYVEGVSLCLEQGSHMGPSTILIDVHIRNRTHHDVRDIWVHGVIQDAEGEILTHGTTRLAARVDGVRASQDRTARLVWKVGTRSPSRPCTLLLVLEDEKGRTLDAASGEFIWS